MDPVTQHITIDRPREAVFAYLVDIANHAEFSDHFLKEWRLTREDSTGPGAGARFRADAPCNRFSWGDLSFAEVDPPYRIVAVGRGGKFNRIRLFQSWTLTPAPGGGTRIDFVAETEPALRTDHLVESLTGFRRWFRRGSGRALRRLRLILEEDADRGARTTVAGR